MSSYPLNSTVISKYNKIFFKTRKFYHLHTGLTTKDETSEMIVDFVIFVFWIISVFNHQNHQNTQLKTKTSLIVELKKCKFLDTA